MKKGLLAVLVASIGFAGVAIAAEKGAAGNGADLMEKRCTACHPVAKVKGAKKNHSQWEATVTNMVSRGAKLTAAEKKTLVDYLAKTYKP
ncbi:hypothetical protein OR1_03218 [Geobacter sp. OR-1]|uniref:hypothetical protein n=1 Tax=Geobacter sp. OR-1 TaxID=1266765 RepID=UPI000541E403|nr:hypothetical protein [Geobacter sp. OR-1]GAM10918.1 hypothetical protein OR1_03218 [Geobacter sp. OR-1]